jgi:ATP-dependent RNA helicase DDX54/DBP10
MSAFEESESKKKAKAGTFQGMGLAPELLNALNRMGYKIPTPVQRKTLPMALAGMDAVVMARTGSGKTGAFLIPLLQRLEKHDSTGGIRAIVLSPTRELAVQTYKFAKDMIKFMDIRIASVIGGEPLEKQFEALSMRPDMLVGTPGRLMHHIREISTLKLKTVKFLVFDEADRLFEMGFAEQLNEIIRECPEERQTMLFSATMPKQLVQFTRAGLRDPQLVRLDSETKMSDELRMSFFTVRSNEKIAALLYLVRRIIPAGDMTIIFTATKHHSEYIQAIFTKIGVSSIVVYGSMDQAAREERLKAFRKGQASYLIVTDLAARGIDIPLLNNVINLHFPMSPKLFVHRCGRAARQGRIGYAMSLVEPEELAHMSDVFLFLDKDVVNTYSSDSIAPDGRVGAGDEVVVGRGNGKSNVSGNAKVALSSHSDGYTLSEMTPEMIHVGALPQIVLDQENEYVKSVNKDDEAVLMASNIAENGMKAYRRTRTEATHHGVSLAKKLVKENRLVNIHPLISGEDPARCSKDIIEQANFIRVLQTFRPGQTILEAAGGQATGSQAVKNSLRNANKKKKVGVNEANQGVEIMRQMRKAVKMGLDRNKEETQRLYDVMAQDGERDEERSKYVEKDDAKGLARVGPTARPREKPAPAWLDKMEAEAEDLEVAYADDDDDDDDVPPGRRAGKASSSSSSSFAVAAGDGGKLRLSVAERKKLKKQGLSNSAVGVMAARKATEQAAGSGVAAAAVSSSSSGSEFGGDFKDSRFYMDYGLDTTEKQSFAEESLQPKAGLRTAEAQQAALMESAMLDVAPDEAMAINKQRRIMRWDAKKRKFVKQSLAEIAEIKGKGKRSRNELTSGIGKSKIPQGEMYAKWAKRTRREVNSAAVAAGHDPDADRPLPKFKNNLGAKDELLNEQQQRKQQKVKENNKLKNMPKAQRRAVEGHNRKKKDQEKAQSAPKMQHKAARKRVKVVMR